MSPRLGLLMLPDIPVRSLQLRATRAEQLGYESLWVADEKFYRDPWVVLSALAQVTHNIRLGTGVTEPYARHPALLAMAIGTLEELAGARITLGLGAGGSGFPPMGVVRSRPAVAIRDAVAIIRSLLAGDRVTYHGEILSFREGSLNFHAAEVPIYVAARGRAMLAAAGAIGDGVILAPFASVAGVRSGIERVRIGAEHAGVPLPQVAVRIDVCIGETAREAQSAVKYFVALPLWSSYPGFAYAEDLGIHVPPLLRDLVARRDYRDIEAAAALLPMEMIDQFAVAGTEADVAERLEALAPLADEIIVHPVASLHFTVDEVIAKVADIWATSLLVGSRGQLR